MAIDHLVGAILGNRSNLLIEQRAANGFAERWCVQQTAEPGPLCINENEVMNFKKEKTMTKIRQLTLVIALCLFCIIILSGCPISGLVRVQENSPKNSVATKQVDAICPSGKKVIGGGYLFFYGGPTVPIRTNAPLLDLSGWRVSGTNTKNTEWSVSAIAICADAE